jgi:hypothetical protein
MAVYKKTGGAGDSPATVLRQLGTAAPGLQDRVKPVREIYAVAGQNLQIRRLSFLEAMETADGRL